MTKWYDYIMFFKLLFSLIIKKEELKMKNLAGKLLTGLLVLGLILGAIGCAKAIPTPTPTTQVQYIKMGSSIPLTGPGAYLGVPVQKTVNLVIDQFNDAGGITIGGMKYLINMIWYDDGYDPVQGRANVEKLVTEDKVQYLVGLFGTTLGSSEQIAIDNKVLVTTTSTGGTEVISPEKQYVFRPYTGATVGAYSIMKWIIENYGVKRFAVLQLEVESAIEITEFYKKVCSDLGVETDVIYYPITTVDFSPMLTKLLSWHPDLLFVGPDALKEARELGYTGIATGMLTTTNVGITVTTAGVQGAEGYLMAQNLDWTATPGARAWHDAYVAKYGTYDDESLTYVGLMEAIIQGIQKANSVDPTAVMLALNQMGEKNEPIHLPIGDAYWAGSLRYGGLNHQLVTPIDMMDIHNGESRLLAVLPPPSNAELVPYGNDD